MADMRLAAYDQSVARCAHGQSGVMFSVHETSTASAFRAALDAATLPEHTEHNRFHRSLEHLRAVTYHSVHPKTLHWAANHEHTRHIEASCVQKRSLPKPLDPATAASLFDGRYYRSDENSESPHCEITVRVARPFARTSLAVVTSNSVEHGDCLPSGRGTSTERHVAQITMQRPHVGDITMTMASPLSVLSALLGPVGADLSALGANNLTGYYQVDPNARLQDEIKWSDGTVWTKKPGRRYNLDSAIGPLDNGTRRTRNPAAYVRWNWGQDRIDALGLPLDDSYTYVTNRSSASPHAAPVAVTGAGTTLYNLDVGVQITHDDFGGRARGGYSAGCPTGRERSCLDGWVYQGVIDSDALNRAESCDGHGTHTASTAVGTKYGVAIAAEVVAVQVLNCSGVSSDAAVIDGINWAINHAIHRVPRKPSVLSLSLGSDTRNRMLAAAVTKANDHGLLVIVAAGNDGGTQKSDACGGAPASVSSAITVGATGLEEDLIVNGKLSDSPQTVDVLAPFSSVGTCVDLFAPGVELLAAFPSGNSTHVTSILSGTSMATPMVAGVALQIMGLHPLFSTNDVRRAILCACEQGAIRGLDTYTRNYLLQGGAQLAMPPLATLIAQQRELTHEQREAGVQPSRDATQCFRAELQASLGSALASVTQQSALPAAPRKAQTVQRQGVLLP